MLYSVVCGHICFARNNTVDNIATVTIHIKGNTIELTICWEQFTIETLLVYPIITVLIYRRFHMCFQEYTSTPVRTQHEKL